jgi:hypothetical protein
LDKVECPSIESLEAVKDGSEKLKSLSSDSDITVSRVLHTLGSTEELCLLVPGSGNGSFIITGFSRVRFSIEDADV